MPRVAIIGAGFGGIAAAVTLAKAGLTNFVVFERSGGPGGVWWDNRYPGAQVDTPSHMYSFSFKRYAWSHSHAYQPELQRYMAETIEERGLAAHFQYNSEVGTIRWDDARAVYDVEVNDEIREFDFVISAVGMLNVPRHPQWPGLEEFSGLVMHTAEWDPDVDLTGKRIAVVGTGSTAAQLVPSIAGKAGRLYVFQREPGWINPKPVRTYTEEERSVMTSPMRYRIQRLKGYFDAAGTRAGGNIHIEGSRSNLAAMEACRAFIRRELGERPELVDLVTPTYGYFGKRPIKDSNFYAALLRDNVELVPRAVEKVTSAGLVDDAGNEFPVDIIVTATGFQVSEYLPRLTVFGRGGAEIHKDVWKGEPAAYLGATVPGFPNFFMIYGPNTNSPVTLFFLEAQARFALRSIRWVGRRGARSIEVRRSAFERFDSWVQDKMRGSVWATANNYFRTGSGRVITQWPNNPTWYWLLAKTTPELSSRVRF
ncbi:NAD(P)/FAD-dependent oxidoreductase [Dactylosporangium sp. NPDC000555]|uniref:flavin-containing monooxygenase n=1 Tax=Dactylosporangium sp. NPDC000555 TaxID=3154260 RepID=UPI003332E623